MRDACVRVPFLSPLRLIGMHLFRDVQDDTLQSTRHVQEATPGDPFVDSPPDLVTPFAESLLYFVSLTPTDRTDYRALPLTLNPISASRARHHSSSPFSVCRCRPRLIFFRRFLHPVDPAPTRSSTAQKSSSLGIRYLSLRRKNRTFQQTDLSSRSPDSTFHLARFGCHDFFLCCRRNDTGILALASALFRVSSWWRSRSLCDVSFSPELGGHCASRFGAALRCVYFTKLLLSPSSPIGGLLAIPSKALRTTEL